jgi:hypothetical protein
LRLPGRYATVRWQIWQRVTGSWVSVTGKRREGDLLICLHDASPAEVILPPKLMLESWKFDRILVSLVARPFN